MTTNEQDPWAEIDQALGLGIRPEIDPDTEPFLRAGFSQEAAAEGATRIRSGRYFGFEDVAISLQGPLFVGTGAVRESQVTLERIRAVAGGLSVVETVLERRTAVQTQPVVVEAAVATPTGQEAVLSVCLIDTGEGSSGHYPATTLQEAATSGVFAAGTHCYIDHPTEAEAFQRPVRSVKELAGCLKSGATYRDGGLWATVRVFESHRQFILDRKDVIGMSIRADAEVAEARRTRGAKPTITKITNVRSVDFVTRAGRGGRIAGLA